MLITIILTLLGLAVGDVLDNPLLYGMLGFLLGRVIALHTDLGKLTSDLNRLREALAADWERRQELKREAAHEAAVEPASEARSYVRPRPGLQVETEAATARAVPGHDERPPSPEHYAPRRPRDETRSTIPTPAPGPVVVFERIRDWINDGNIFVRIGILLLFLGVGFLIKYAVDRELLVFTMEMRILAIAIGALLLVGIGWYLRTKKRDYALLLQGAAIGLLYLDIYGSYQLYHLISAGPAFGLLFLVGLLSAGLAVLQDASPLAWFGFAGGFLAPIIASGGSDDQIVLFSYFALLNAALLTVAWFKSWRALNLLGFAFTYGIAGAWGVLRYEPTRFAATEPFLVVFFLFYVGIAVLYAIRQPPRFRGYIDTTLIFGTPLLTFAYQIELVRHIDYGIAWSAFTMGAFYLTLAGLVRRRAGKGLKLLSEAFLALGVVFLSVAIPFTFDAEQTSGAWALEGAGLLWVGVRQARGYARIFGLLLQAGAAVLFVEGYPYPAAMVFLNNYYLAAGMIALAAALSAYWLDRVYEDKRPWEAGAVPWLVIWALAWWFGAGSHELYDYYSRQAFPSGLLLYAISTAVVVEALAVRWPWGIMDRVETGLPLIGFAALAFSLHALDHPAESGGIWAWPLFLMACYMVLYRIEKRDEHRYLAWGHVAVALLIAGVLEWELVWLALKQLDLKQGWRVAAYIVAPLALLQLAFRAEVWPAARWQFSYRTVVGGVLASSIVIWILGSIGSPGGSAPVPWLPLLNPLDLTVAAALLTLWQWWQRVGARSDQRLTAEVTQMVWVLLGTLGFLWLNLALLRALHHWAGVPYDVVEMFRSVSVQMSVAVLWGITGVSLLLAAGRLSSRAIWIAGALIIAAVVIKLFLVDLAAHGTVERIVSFLAVGGLLVAIGWFSPFPPKKGNGDSVGVADQQEQAG